MELLTWPATGTGTETVTETAGIGVNDEVGGAVWNRSPPECVRAPLWHTETAALAQALLDAGHEGRGSAGCVI